MLFSWLVWWPLFLVASFGYFAVAVASLGDPRNRLRRTIARSTCPDCGYVISSPWPDAGGPDACPECGVPYPLLPPPVVDRRG